MDIKSLYENRFDNVQERKLIWKILVKDFFQKYISKNNSVLEIACGYGEFINEIKCGKKYAIDLNPDSSKYLDKSVTFYRESSINIKPLKKKFIDKIFVSNFFEHINRDEIMLTIKECFRVLKKGGQILILQPNIRFCEKDYWMFFDHITPIDDRALTEAFLSNGFILKKLILRFLPYTTKSRLPKSDIFIRLYLKLPFLWRIFGRQSFLIFEKKE